MDIINIALRLGIDALLFASVVCGERALFVVDGPSIHLTCSENSVFIVDNMDVIKCAILCELEHLCSGFTFRETKGDCVGCQGGDASLDTIDVGMEYYLSQSPKWGQTCRPGLVCPGDNQECLDGVCICSPGYSFQAATRSCQAGCSQYGDTFQRYKGVRLFANNFDQLSNGVTLSECIDACLASTSPLCISFEFSDDLSACQLQSVTFVDEPLAYDENAQYDYYNRNC